MNPISLKDQGYKARKVICCGLFSAYIQIETSSLRAVFVNKISATLVSEEDKSILIILIIHITVFYDQNIALIFYVKDGSMSGCDIRLVFTLPPRDSTLQYKRSVHLLNNYLYIIILWV